MGVVTRSGCRWGGGDGETGTDVCSLLAHTELHHVPVSRTLSVVSPPLFSSKPSPRASLNHTVFLNLSRHTNHTSPALLPASDDPAHPKGCTRCQPRGPRQQIHLSTCQQVSALRPWLHFCPLPETLLQASAQAWAHTSSRLPSSVTSSKKLSLTPPLTTPHTHSSFPLLLDLAIPGNGD